jgi:putative endonuclease
MENCGTFYEECAVTFLGLKGYKVLKRNFKCNFGEIDIIAQDKNAVVFVEVKARNHDYRVSGLEAVDRRKRQRIRKTALAYTSTNPDRFFRFDVLEIIQGVGFRQYNLIKAAFTMDEE